MKKAEIREIVRETITELIERDLIATDEDVAYKYMGNRLIEYYSNGEPDGKIKDALEKMEREDYFCVIEMYYKDCITILQISDYMDCDQTTVSRRKKELVLKLYRMVYV